MKNHKEKESSSRSLEEFYENSANKPLYDRFLEIQQRKEEKLEAHLRESRYK